MHTHNLKSTPEVFQLKAYSLTGACTFSSIDLKNGKLIPALKHVYNIYIYIFVYIFWTWSIILISFKQITGLAGLAQVWIGVGYLRPTPRRVGSLL